MFKKLVRKLKKSPTVNNVRINRNGASFEFKGQGFGLKNFRLLGKDMILLYEDGKLGSRTIKTYNVEKVTMETIIKDISTKNKE